MTLAHSESAPSVQEEIFRTLLRTPHRSVDESLETHKTQLERDPFLYGHLASYAVHHGECAVRDLQDVFVATLFVSEFSEHRDAAWVMLQALPPYRVVRVLKYMTGYSEIITHTSCDEPMPTRGAHGVVWDRAHYGKNHRDPDLRGKVIPSAIRKVTAKVRRHLPGAGSEITIDRYRVSHACHAKNLNRVVRSAVETYLRYREDNPALMEGAILRMKDAMRTLYAKCHLLPGKDEDSWINRALFHNDAPEGSRIQALKKLIASNDPAEQAKLIMGAKLPYPVVKPLVKTITPSVLVALIDVMSPQELLANLGAIKREGAFDNADIKKLVQDKIKKIAKSKKGKVDAMKGEIALEAVADLDEETKALVTEVTDKQLKLHGQISVPTVLLIDKSSSMTDAIEMGKKLGAVIAQAAGDNYVSGYLFGSTVQQISWDAKDGDISSYSAWNKKLKMARADGCTDLGACITAMIRSNVRADQIVIITDEGENGRPDFASLLPKYEAKFGHIPDIVIVRLGRYACDNVERSCKQAGAQVSVMDVKDIDKISIPNLLQLLSKKSVFDLVQEIIELPMPNREDWNAKNKKKAKAAEATN